MKEGEWSFKGWQEMSSKMRGIKSCAKEQEMATRGRKF